MTRTAPNCTFIIDDLEQEWDYPETRRFNYIHQRSMSGSIGNWPAMYRQALTSLEHGGWLEIQEFEVWFYSQKPGGLPEDSAIVRWQNLIDEASLALGRRLNYASRFKAHLEEAGFSDVQTQIIKVSKISKFGHILAPAAYIHTSDRLIEITVSRLR